MLRGLMEKLVDETTVRSILEEVLERSTMIVRAGKILKELSGDEEQKEGG